VPVLGRQSAIEKLAKNVPEIIGTKRAIPYQRVSTSAQSSNDKSGLDRQDRAIQEWLDAHPEYERDRERERVEVASGAKSGRFEWFIAGLASGELPRGTCLLVEKVSRFSREPIEDALDVVSHHVDQRSSSLSRC
jgi:DNA invertase Pin-like site-specific DNA recombinase